jgi:membrane-bound lytic murein transglycosylase B
MTRRTAPALCAALAATLMALPIAQAKAKHPAHPRKTAAVQRDDAPDVVTYGQRDDVMRYAAELAERQPALEREWVQAQLQGARFVPTVARLIMPPPAGSAKNWQAYRARFVEPQRIQAGLQFWQANADTLARAEAEFGVPAEVVVGIIGVETYYGRLTGSFRVLDALATLSFDFPSGRSDRTPFFRNELEQFLLWCRREGRDPAAVRGSYAGAIGLPQFMPSSIVRLAVDYDGDGHVDLLGSAADAIGSVARYLADAGWQRGLPATYEAAPPTDTVARATLLAPDIVPSFSAEQMAAQGALLPPAALQHPGPLALVELQNGDAAPSYVAGTRNFYALTRYNWSSYYAMAVLDLGAAVGRERLSLSAR